MFTPFVLLILTFADLPPFIPAFHNNPLSKYTNILAISPCYRFDINFILHVERGTLIHKVN